MTLLIGSTGIAGLFSALGLNWTTFILDGLAFLVVVFILRRYVYPPLVKAIDEKAEEIKAAAKAKATAEEMLEKTHTQADKIIAEAQASASDIVATAHGEADDIVAAARKKAETQADRIVAEGREQVARDVEDARRQLRGEMVKAVAAATEELIDENLSDDADSKLIEKTLAGRR